jgi:hypothetical protein
MEKFSAFGHRISARLDKFKLGELSNQEALGFHIFKNWHAQMLFSVRARNYP